MRFPVARFSALWLGLAIGACASAPAINPDAPAPDDALMPYGAAVFRGDSGERADWNTLFADLDAADIVVVGESHKDADGHALQRALIVQAAQRWGRYTLSLEEFDRSQQSDLDAYAQGELTQEQLKAVRAFVDPTVRDNWDAWYYPKIAAARDGGAELLAANAPLKYSRLVRNTGCSELPALPDDERALFECAAAPPNETYRERFDRRMQTVARQNRQTGLKPLEETQLERMFEAHQVWDATMADSVVQASRRSGERVVHIVGGFHTDYDGGLIDELRYRDPQARIIVISLVPRRSAQLRPTDRDRADWVIYTR